MLLSRSVVLVLAFLSLWTVVQSQGLVNPLYKQHGGPVEEGQRELQLPDPTTISHTSIFALKRVLLSDNGVGNGRFNNPSFTRGGDGAIASFFIESRRTPRFQIFSSDDVVSSDVKLGFLRPGKSGAFSDVDSEVQSGGLIGNNARFNEGGLDLPARVYRFTAPSNVGGQLLVKASRGPKTGGRDVQVFVMASSDSPFVLQVQTTNLHYFTGEPVVIRASIYDSTVAGQRPAGSIEAGSVLLEYENQFDQAQSLFMTSTPDGWSTGSFVPTASGHYRATVHVVAILPSGERIERTQILSLHVVVRNVAIGNVQLSDDENGNVFVSIGVRQGPNAASKYIVYGEIFGTDPSTGAVSPVSYLNGISDVVNGTLNFAVHPDWFYRSSATAPYEVRNLRLTDVDTYSVLATSQRSPASNSGSSFFVNRGPARNIDITDEMRQGRHPSPATRRLLQSSNPKLLLIHGYCASAPPYPASQFTNAATFSDLNQARSHDQFAILIYNFGLPYTSYGAVAHSQGGCASLHLYTYYWSGFDYSSGNRLIQSVGTPYQGTNLAGILAQIGAVFGVGCGSVTDLTYSGAASWLANIPSWARTRVYYYTTSFTDNWWSYDYCNLATDPFLSDPDDGVVEKAYAQLPGANNMGHTTGECHIPGMRDPPQCQDSGRNSIMNANANR